MRRRCTLDTAVAKAKEVLRNLAHDSRLVVPIFVRVISQTTKSAIVEYLTALHHDHDQARMLTAIDAAIEYYASQIADPGQLPEPVELTFESIKSTLFAMWIVDGFVGAE
jgi:hypothetical protein